MNLEDLHLFANKALYEFGKFRLDPANRLLLTHCYPFFPRCCPFYERRSQRHNLIRKLKNSIPPEFENDVQVEDDKAYAGGRALVPCPKCESDDIVYSQDFDADDFDDEDSSSDEEVPAGLTEGATPRWRCNSCGYEWPDDDAKQG